MRYPPIELIGLLLFQIAAYRASLDCVIIAYPGQTYWSGHNLIQLDADHFVVQVGQPGANQERFQKRYRQSHPIRTASSCPE